MGAYRLYFIGPDGHIVMCEDRDLPDDAAAIEEAERLSEGRPIEVWQLDRMVTKVTKKKNGLTPGDLFNRFLKATGQT